MARKFYTCIIVPDASQQLHKLRVPIQALYGLAGLGLLSFFVVVGLGFHYIGMASRLETLYTLQAENEQLKVDTRQLRLATTQLSRQVAELESEAEIITKAIQEDPILRKLGGTPAGGSTTNVPTAALETGNLDTLQIRLDDLEKELALLDAK